MTEAIVSKNEIQDDYRLSLEDNIGEKTVGFRGKSVKNSK